MDEEERRSKLLAGKEAVSSIILIFNHACLAVRMCTVRSVGFNKKYAEQEKRVRSFYLTNPFSSGLIVLCDTNCQICFRI